MADTEQDSGAEQRADPSDQPGKPEELAPVLDSTPDEGQPPTQQEEGEGRGGGEGEGQGGGEGERQGVGEGEGQGGGEGDTAFQMGNPDAPALLSESPPRYDKEAAVPEEQPKPKPQQAAPVRTAQAPRPPPSRPPAPARPAAAAAKPPPPVPSGPETAQERKAREFMEQAEKKVKSAQGFFGSLFG